MDNVGCIMYNVKCENVEQAAGLIISRNLASCATMGMSH